jgi:hypothetical protein
MHRKGFVIKMFRSISIEPNFRFIEDRFAFSKSPADLDPFVRQPFSKSFNLFAGSFELLAKCFGVFDLVRFKVPVVCVSDIANPLLSICCFCYCLG